MKLTKKQINQKWKSEIVKKQEEKFEEILRLALTKIVGKLKDLYDYLVLIDVPEFYSKEYTYLMTAVKKKMKSIDEFMLAVIEESILAIYKEVSENIPELKNWAEDGLSIKDRLYKADIWLVASLQKAMVDYKATGRNINYEQIISSYTLSLKRIVETEMSYYYNEGLLESIDGEFYVYLTAKDEAVCGDCKRLDGRVFPKTDKSHMPPRHPNCRCRISEV